MGRPSSNLWARFKCLFNDFFCQLLLTVCSVRCGPIHSIRRLVTVLHTKRCQWSNGIEKRMRKIVVGEIVPVSVTLHRYTVSPHPHCALIVFTVHKTSIFSVGFFPSSTLLLSFARIQNHKKMLVKIPIRRDEVRGTCVRLMLLLLFIFIQIRSDHFAPISFQSSVTEAFTNKFFSCLVSFFSSISLCCLRFRSLFGTTVKNFVISLVYFGIWQCNFFICLFFFPHTDRFT